MLTLQEISDRLEIQDLLHRYAEIIDGVFENGNVNALRTEVFTEDARIDPSDLGYPECGVSEFISVFDRDVTPENFHGMQHLNGSHQIKLDGDRASGRIMCLASALVPLPDGGKRLIVTAVCYLDKYVRTDRGWRIQERVEDVTFTESLPVLNIEPD